MEPLTFPSSGQLLERVGAAGGYLPMAPVRCWDWAARGFSEMVSYASHLVSTGHPSLYMHSAMGGPTCKLDILVPPIRAPPLVGLSKQTKLVLPTLVAFSE